MQFEWRPWEIAGWIGALAVQLPETHGLEIDQVVPDSLDEEVVRHAFIASIVWRKPKAFSVATRKRISDLLARQDGAAEEVLEALVSVTARPDHPYNGDRLDGLLRPLLMADRDAFWSQFLFGKMGEENSVQRLIDWAGVERTESHFSDEVARLASLTLVWFLTTSDRFVRDRASKAIVALLEGRIQVMRCLLNHFSGLVEPYVQERLYAAAYGCAMRTQQTAELRHLAQEVYNQVFRVGVLIRRPR